MAKKYITNKKQCQRDVKSNSLLHKIHMSMNNRTIDMQESHGYLDDISIITLL